MFSSHWQRPLVIACTSYLFHYRNVDRTLRTSHALAGRSFDESCRSIVDELGEDGDAPWDGQCGARREGSSEERFALACGSLFALKLLSNLS